VWYKAAAGVDVVTTAPSSGYPIAELKLGYEVAAIGGCGCARFAVRCSEYGWIPLCMLLELPCLKGTAPGPIGAGLS
jgi:hypothetical protein